MKRFYKYLIAFLIPIVLVCLVILLLPLDQRFAYTFVKGDCSGHAKWIHDRLYENDEPIDVAIVGSSIGWGFFDDKTISQALTDSLSQKTNVVNLSYCRPGLNIRTMLIKELIRTKQPRHIVLEVRIKPSKGGHPMYGYMAPTEDLLNPATRLYQAYPKDFKNSLVVKWEQVKQHLYPTKEYKPDLNTYGVGVSEVLADQAFMKDVKERNARQNPHPEQTLQEMIHFYVYWQNLEHIAALCDENGIQFSLCFINQIGRTSGVPRFREKTEQIADLWYPPDSIFQKPEYYSDIIHYNEDGMNALTPFLIENLLEAERSKNNQ